MFFDSYLRQVQDQIAAASALGDERTREVAAALATAAGASVRLALVESGSALVGEINTALLEAHGGPNVTVRLAGDELQVDVVRLDAEPLADAPDSAEGRADEGKADARISLRLTESLKNDIDAAATREGISVNTWLVRAAGLALAGPSRRPDGPDFGRPWFGDLRTGPGARGQRINGWVTG